MRVRSIAGKFCSALFDGGVRFDFVGNGGRDPRAPRGSTGFHDRAFRAAPRRETRRRAKPRSEKRLANRRETIGARALRDQTAGPAGVLSGLRRDRHQEARARCPRARPPNLPRINANDPYATHAVLERHRRRRRERSAVATCASDGPAGRDPSQLERFCFIRLKVAGALLRQNAGRPAMGHMGRRRPARTSATRGPNSRWRSRAFTRSQLAAARTRRKLDKAHTREHCPGEPSNPGDQRCPRRPARRNSQRSRRVLDAVHAQPRVQEAAAADLARQGHALLHAGGPRGARRDGGAVVLQRRPQPRPDRRGDPAPGGRTRLRADLPVRPSPGLRAVARASRRWRPAISTTCSSPIPVRRRSTPR